MVFRTVLAAAASATALVLGSGIAHADIDDVRMIALDRMVPLSPMSQQQAAKKARDYLDSMPFSRQGLITQLVNIEHFSTDDATYGVDSLNADWNQQAAKKAKDYLESMAFSHDGLITQLVSIEKFTPSQAAYGVNAVGL